MISLNHLVEFPEQYTIELTRRFKDPEVVSQICGLYTSWKTQQSDLDVLRQKKNQFNDQVVKLSGEEKRSAIESMKSTSEEIKQLEVMVKEVRTVLDEMVLKIPNLSWDDIPIGRSDDDNPVTGHFNPQPSYGFTPKPYWELPVYREYVSQEDGVKAMGSRGYYMHGQMALFQKVLFDYALEVVLSHGFELFYVPLMLNEKVLTGTGHLPDFDGQQYETPIDEGKSFYLIGSSEPSIMGYFMGKQIGDLAEPILATCWSSCFRKEAGSYGKDQQGILRVHQFEKVEMVGLMKPESADEMFGMCNTIVQEIYSGLGLHYRAVEVCSGDMPPKHRRQVDYEAWFPAVEKYREICSNGNASDYQNRGLGITYTDSDGTRQTPWGFNCTAITFRTGLAILEQFQQEDGSVMLPEVLSTKMGRNTLG
jgi:seryl-tRNA synthetase